MISIFQGTDKNCDMKYRRGQKINSLLIPNFKYREARIFYLSRDLSTIIFILNIDVRIFYFSRFIGHHFYFKCREARISSFAWFADNQFNYRVTILVSSRYDRFTGATDKNGNATFVFYMAYTSRSTLNAYQAHYTRSSGFRTRKCLPLARRVRLRVVACNLRNIFFNEKKEKRGKEEDSRNEWKSIEIKERRSEM